MTQWTPAERAIYEAVQAVEALPADVRLTDAVVLLQEARENVADYVDGIDQRPSALPTGELAALRERHAAAVEAAFTEGYCGVFPMDTAPSDAAWLASSARKGVTP